MKKKTIVISAVNLVEGGPLTILRECLDALSQSEISQTYKVVALVHSQKLLPSYSNIELMEYPLAKRNYLFRCYYEYLGFHRLSKKLKPYLWLSLHDMSPRVKAERQAVYMHNPSPFYKASFQVVLHAFTYALFSWFYKYVYRINLHANDYLIVQQQWLRDEFSKMFSFPKERIVVAPPERVNSGTIMNSANSILAGKEDKDDVLFFFPAFPRSFKNFEVICNAVRILENDGIRNFGVVLTIDGSENGYSKQVVLQNRDLNTVVFKGLLAKDEVEAYYVLSDCLIFPSLLETWGLPISEYIPFRKPMLIADLPYAHETAAGAESVAFFNPNDAQELAKRMSQVINHNVESFNPVPLLEIEFPKAYSWRKLFDILLH